MNCDLVFEILTRGPFPTGEPTDASVELHLSRCHECRRLAEALRPAVELFHEALVSEAEVDSLPGYYGALCEAEEFRSTAVAIPPLRSKRAPFLDAAAKEDSWRLLPRAGQWAGGLLLGMAACFVLAFLLVQFSESGSSGGLAASGSPAVSSDLPPGGDVPAFLESLQLPAVCVTQHVEHPAHEGAGVAGHAADHRLCCTQCHSAAEPRRPAVSAVALLQSEACNACHQFE